MYSKIDFADFAFSFHSLLVNIFLDCLIERGMCDFVSCVCLFDDDIIHVE